MKLKPPATLDRIRCPRLFRRIMSNTTVANDTPRCWEWQGYKNSKGYGQIKFKGRAHWVHRISYALFNGSIPKGMEVHHECYNTSCCNPNHLNLMSKSENSKERHARHN